MHHSVSDVDQYTWPDVQDIPIIFPSSPAPSNCSTSGTPQTQLDLYYDPNSTSFYQNSFKESEDFYPPSCAQVSTPPAEPRDVWNEFLQLYSANPRPPGRSARQAPPGQQLVFGDAQSHFSFDLDDFCLSPTTYRDPIPAVPNAPNPARHPPQEQPAPPCFLPHPPPSANQMPFSQNGQLDGRNFLTCPVPLEPFSEPDDPPRQGGSRVTASPPKRQPTQRASGSSKKRKTGKADNGEEIVLLQCCTVVKPESLARHLKSDGHKRNAGLPLDRPEVCTLCNIAFARQDARNRHFRSQHGGDPSPATVVVYKRLKKPSATHPSLLPKRRK